MNYTHTHIPASSKRSKAGNEEAQSRERYHVDSQFPKVGVELSGEPEAGSDTRRRQGHQVVQVAVGRGGQLEGSEANVVERLIVNAVSLVGVFEEHVNRKCGVVRLHHSI